MDETMDGTNTSKDGVNICDRKNVCPIRIFRPTGLTILESMQSESVR